MRISTASESKYDSRFDPRASQLVFTSSKKIIRHYNVTQLASKAQIYTYFDSCLFLLFRYNNFKNRQALHSCDLCHLKFSRIFNIKAIISPKLGNHQITKSLWVSKILCNFLRIEYFLSIEYFLNIGLPIGFRSAEVIRFSHPICSVRFGLT